MKKIGLALLAVPSLAGAQPTITAGVAVGLTESAKDADAGGTSSDSLSIFGRINLMPRVAGQLELERIESTTPGADIRTGTAFAVIDLASRGRLMPIVMVGIGVDDATDGIGDSTTGYHVEGGLGLEYRADGGLTIGGDLRMGSRSISANPALETYATPVLLQDGDFRSARLYCGIRF